MCAWLLWLGLQQGNVGAVHLTSPSRWPHVPDPHVPQAHYVLDEMLLNGCILDTNKTNVLAPIKDLEKYA